MPTPTPATLPQPDTTQGVILKGDSDQLLGSQLKHVSNLDVELQVPCNQEANSISSVNPLQFIAFAVIGGSGSIGSRFGSPRAPRTSISSNSSEGATTDVGSPFCAVPKAPSAVPEIPAIWLCM